MALTDSSKADIAFKKLVGVDVQELGDPYYQEKPGGGFNVHATEVFASAIPADAPPSTTTVVKVYVDGADGALKLTQDMSVPGSRGWAAEAPVGTRLRNWIPPKYDPTLPYSYTVKLYNDNGSGTAKGAQIDATDAMDWFFDYETGFLTIQDAHTKTTPFWIEGYRYIGLTVAADLGAAIHDNVAGEINAVTVKGTPVSADVLLIEDSAASFAKKSITVGTLPGHALLDGSTHTDTVAQLVTRGSLVVGNVTPKWDELGIGTTGKFLRSDGTDPSWQLLGSADVATAGAVMDTDFGVNGLMVRTGAGAYTNRSIAVADAKLTIVNGDGVSGNPTLGFGSVAASDLSNGVSGSGAVILQDAPNIDNPTIRASNDTNVLEFAGVTSAVNWARFINAASGDAAVLEALASLHIRALGTGDLIFEGQKWPQAIGTTGQYLKITDAGSSQLGWGTPAGAGTMTTVKLNGSQVGGADIVTLDFSSAFTVSETPDTEINVGVADGADSTAIHDNQSGEINAIASKATPIGADLVVIEDSEASYAKKKATLSTLPITMPTKYITISKEFYIQKPTSADVFPICYVPKAITITEIIAVTAPATSTVTFNVEIRGKLTPYTAGTDVMVADLVATSSGVSYVGGGSGWNDNTVDDAKHLVLVASAEANSPTKLTVDVVGTIT